MGRILNDDLKVSDLISAIKETTDVAEKTRIKAIIKIKEGKTGKEIARELIVSVRSINGWVKRYREKGLAGLKTKRSGRREGNPKWDKQIFNELTREIDNKEQYWSIPLMAEWIKKKYNKDIPHVTILYHLKKLGYSHTSARPYPYKADKDRQEEFKKTASQSWSRVY